MTYRVMYEDARGWHETKLSTAIDVSSSAIRDWATRGNDALRRLIDRGYAPPMALNEIITRVVVTDETGAKVCEWPEVEREAV